MLEQFRFFTQAVVFFGGGRLEDEEEIGHAHGHGHERGKESRPRLTL